MKTPFPLVQMSSIGREPNSLFPYLIDVIRRSGDLGVLAPLNISAENNGDTPLTIVAYQSNDNGATDSWTPITFRVDGGASTTIAMNPKVSREFSIEGVTKPYLMFKTTQKSVAGRMAINYTAGTLDSVQLPRSVPAAPSGLGSAVAFGGITLTWTDNSDDEEQFIIYRSLDGTTYAQIFQVAPGSTSYTDTNVLPDTAYYYKVSSKNQSGESALSSSTTKTSAPAAPSAITATQFSDVRVDLAWTDNATTETGFSIQHSTDGITWAQVATPAANATTASISGLAEGVLHYFRILAVGTAGNSAYSNIASAWTKVSAPSGLAIGHTVAGRLDLTWTDNSTHETGFSVERSPDGTTGWVQVGTPAANAVAFSNTGLTTGNHWYYRVKATSGNGDSAYSGTVNDTVA